MKVTVNEEVIEMAEPADVTVVLKSLDIDLERRGIAVAVNDQVVRRAEWSAHVISAGDRIEIIQATQGG